MKLNTFLSIVFLVIINTSAFNQSIINPDSIYYVENAGFRDGDITQFISSIIKYPGAAIEARIHGDVVISFLIDKNGIFENLKILETPDISLSASSIVALNSIENRWSSCKINGTPVDKKYQMIFRYRIYIGGTPPDSKRKADISFGKGKYEKAVKLYDKAIKDNKYDYELFISRSDVKKMVGDVVGADQDKMISDSLRNNILSVINISAKAIPITNTSRTVPVGRVVVIETSK